VEKIKQVEEADGGRRGEDTLLYKVVREAAWRWVKIISGVWRKIFVVLKQQHKAVLGIWGVAF
jgi:hypothetical protein